MSNSELKYSVVTTCKNRLQYLMHSLPSFLDQADAEVIVVDYNCPQRTAELVTEKFPRVRAIRVPDVEGFNLPRARNIGASQAKGSILAFVDADVVLGQNFLAEMGPKLSRNTFGIFDEPAELRGTCLVHRAAFDRVQGYDEVVVGYAWEDLDFYRRLMLAGYGTVPLDMHRVRVIEHTDEERVQYYDTGRRLSYARGKIYHTAKETLLLLSYMKYGFELPLQLRQNLFAKVNELTKDMRSFEHPGLSLTIDMPLEASDQFLPDIDMARSVTIKVRLKTNLKTDAKPGP